MKRRENCHRLCRLAGIAIATFGLLLVWLGVGLLRVGSFGYGLLLITGGLYAVNHWMSQAIADKKQDRHERQDESAHTDDFNSECFPSHLSGKCNTPKGDK